MGTFFGLLQGRCSSGGEWLLKQVLWWGASKARNDRHRSPWYSPPIGPKIASDRSWLSGMGGLKGAHWRSVTQNWKWGQIMVDLYCSSFLPEVSLSTMIWRVEKSWTRNGGNLWNAEQDNQSWTKSLEISTNMLRAAGCCFTIFLFKFGWIQPSINWCPSLNWIQRIVKH